MIDKHLFKSKINQLDNKDYLFDLYAKLAIYQNYNLLTEIITTPYKDYFKVSPNEEIVNDYRSDPPFVFRNILLENLNRSLKYTKRLEQHELFMGIYIRRYDNLKSI